LAPAAIPPPKDDDDIFDNLFWTPFGSDFLILPVRRISNLPPRTITDHRLMQEQRDPIMRSQTILF
jgi:hypothetical protein